MSEEKSVIFTRCADFYFRTFYGDSRAEVALGFGIVFGVSEFNIMERHKLCAESGQAAPCLISLKRGGRHIYFQFSGELTGVGKGCGACRGKGSGSHYDSAQSAAAGKCVVAEGGEGRGQVDECQCAGGLFQGRAGEAEGVIADTLHTIGKGHGGSIGGVGKHGAANSLHNTTVYIYGLNHRGTIYGLLRLQVDKHTLGGGIAGVVFRHTYSADRHRLHEALCGVKGSERRRQ